MILRMIESMVKVALRKVEHNGIDNLTGLEALLCSHG